MLVSAYNHVETEVDIHLFVTVGEAGLREHVRAEQFRLAKEGCVPCAVDPVRGIGRRDGIRQPIQVRDNRGKLMFVGSDPFAVRIASIDQIVCAKSVSIPLNIT